MLSGYPGHRITFILLMVFAFLMPLAPFSVPLISSLFILNWFISGDFLRVKLILKSPQAPGLIFMVVLWLWLAFSLFYSSNLGEGFSKLETKLSFLLMPLAIGTSSVRSLSLRQKHNIFQAFAVGTILSAVILILLAAFKCYQGLPPTYWFYSGFSFIIHPSYYSMYLLFAAAIVWFISPSFLLGKLRFITYLLLFLALVLSGSKAGGIGLLLLTSVLIVWEYHQVKIYYTTILGLLLPLIIFVLALFLLPPALERMRETQQTAEILSGNRIDDQGGYPSSTGMRLVLWKSALKVWSESPILGVGLGDVHDELDKKSMEANNTLAYQKHLNAHNQFLQTAVAGGAIALIIFLIILIMPFFRYEWRKNYLALFFVLLTSMNFLFESILEKQAGTVFFAFFYVVLLLTIQKENKNETAI